jgi:hypothetical protein
VQNEKAEANGTEDEGQKGLKENTPNKAKFPCV